MGDDVAMLLEPYTLRGVTLRNRIVVSPMCQYFCTNRDGLATDWHMVHLGSRAVGGAGLVLTEASRHAQGAAVGIQFAHAGRKASTSSTWTGGRAVADAEGRARDASRHTRRGPCGLLERWRCAACPDSGRS
jgi:2,4-dienoyl-CoA reductase-like NADH-dependent reductase (Old Yellow Enzyme family)